MATTVRFVGLNTGVTAPGTKGAPAPKNPRTVPAGTSGLTRVRKPKPVPAAFAAALLGNPNAAEIMNVLRFTV